MPVQRVRGRLGDKGECADLARVNGMGLKTVSGQYVCSVMWTRKWGMRLACGD